jgi:hypothetical protein
MNFDQHGRLLCTPPEIYELAVRNPDRLLHGYLLVSTPFVFADYSRYCDFLEAVSDRTGVHAKNLYVRGSAHIGFSIAPDNAKLWMAVRRKSDLDLVIVDADYFQRCEEELRRWEVRNPVKSAQGKAAKAAAYRALDRRFNCVRDTSFPNVVCVHHRKMMAKIAAMAHCGHERDVSAFLFPDWHSAQERYEFDLRELQRGVTEGWLTPPPEQPIPRDDPNPAPAEPFDAGQAVAAEGAGGQPAGQAPEESAH